MAEFQWAGWVRQSAQPEWLETIEAMLENPGKYGARLHLMGPQLVQGKDGGAALCGVAVPADDPDVIKFWVDERDNAPKCKNCERKEQS